MKISHLLFILACLFFFGCKTSPKSTAVSSDEADIARQEARDDSLELVAAYKRQARIQNFVSATYETDDIASDNVSDAADDPAIWVHPTEPEKSIIIGSNKRGGIHLYNLQGKEIAYSPVGNVNNVDVIPSFQLAGKSIILVGGSNRTDQSIDLLMLDPEKGDLQDVAANALKVNSEEIDDIYGFCFYQDREMGKSYVFINGKNGRLQQFELMATEAGKIDVRKVREVLFNSQVEGMVVDDLYESLYVGEEGEGIWKLSAAADGGSHKRLISMSGEENKAISYDIEGLAIYKKGKGGYLLASSQGNFSYAAFDRLGENRYIGSFVIKASDTLDGVEETDGIEASPAYLGEEFPQGVFLAQDGFNHLGEELHPQNFKIVDWREIESVLSPLSSDGDGN